jgi:proline racemase
VRRDGNELLATLGSDYGGGSFVIADAAALGFSLIRDEARYISRLGIRITDAANEQIGFQHPITRTGGTSRSVSSRCRSCRANMGSKPAIDGH